MMKLRELLPQVTSNNDQEEMMSYDDYEEVCG